MIVKNDFEEKTLIEAGKISVEILEKLGKRIKIGDYEIGRASCRERV